MYHAAPAVLALMWGSVVIGTRSFSHPNGVPNRLSVCANHAPCRIMDGQLALAASGTRGTQRAPRWWGYGE